MPIDDLTPIEHGRRVRRIQQLLAAGEVGTVDASCDALLVTDPHDLRWLTGFGGSLGWAVVRTDELIVGTDLRYRDRAAVETASSGARIVAHQSRPDLHRAMIESLAGANVALDASTTTHAAWTVLAAEVELCAAPSPIAMQRGVKDDAEIERIAAAAATADAAMAEVEPILLDTINQPVTEADIRNELEYRMRLHGADDRSYHTIVATGPNNAARPHHEVGQRTIVDGDTVVIDVGGLVDGYHSDMTRSFVVGEPSQQQREIYELVAASQAAGLAALGDDIAAVDVDTACRQVFAAAGYGEWFIHGTGHGVGLQIHESPFHSQASAETVRGGNVVTVEPGLYRDGFGGLRIEDLVVVTSDGYRCLTHHPKRPFAT